MPNPLLKKKKKKRKKKAIDSKPRLLFICKFGNGAAPLQGKACVAYVVTTYDLLLPLGQPTSALGFSTKREVQFTLPRYRVRFNQLTLAPLRH